MVLGGMGAANSPGGNNAIPT